MCVLEQAMPQLVILEICNNFQIIGTALKHVSLAQRPTFNTPTFESSKNPDIAITSFLKAPIIQNLVLKQRSHFTIIAFLKIPLIKTLTLKLIYAIMTFL